MSWSCSLIGKDKENLLIKYNINGQLIGLAPNCLIDTDVHYRLDDIRNVMGKVEFANEYPKAAQLAIRRAKNMIEANLEELKVCHCETCTCEAKACNWNMEIIKRFLSIPLEEIESLDCGW